MNEGLGRRERQKKQLGFRGTVSLSSMKYTLQYFILLIFAEIIYSTNKI